MNPHQLLSAMAQRSRLAQSDSAPGIRLGEVETYDASSGTARVRIQPEGYVTDYLPILTHWVGPGWGMAAGLYAGDQVVIAFELGHPEGGVILGGIFSGGQPPMGVPAGEMWAVHASGAFIKLTDAPALALGDGSGGTLTISGGNITSAGTWSHTGAITASGEVTAKSTHTVSQHTHPSNGALPTG